jgi:hypothetical protein
MRAVEYMNAVRLCEIGGVSVLPCRSAPVER